MMAIFTMLEEVSYNYRYSYLPLASLSLFSHFIAARPKIGALVQELLIKILIDEIELSHQSMTRHMGLNSGHVLATTLTKLYFVLPTLFIACMVMWQNSARQNSSMGIP